MLTSYPGAKPAKPFCTSDVFCLVKNYGLIPQAVDGPKKNWRGRET